jgi:hypothetical protein
MKKIALLVASILILTGCAQGTTEKVYENGVPVNYFFVSDTPRGFKLFSETQNFLVEEGDLNLQVVSDLVSGAVVPLDPQYVNLWGNGNTVNSITVNQGVAKVDLGTVKLNVGAEGEQRAIDQIVWTLTEVAPEITSVSFTVNGETVETFAGHVDTTVRFERAIDYEVLNPIQISSINQGAVLTSPVTISGQACTFEANVVWRLSKEDKVVTVGYATAAAACPERSEWKVELGELEPGDYTFQAFENSAEDGNLVAIDDKDFRVK